MFDDRIVSTIFIVLIAMGGGQIYLCSRCESDTCTGWCYPIATGVATFIFILGLGYFSILFYEFVNNKCKGDYDRLTTTGPDGEDPDGVVERDQIDLEDPLGDLIGTPDSLTGSD